MRRVEISETQRGLKIKGGTIQTILDPGRYWIFDIPFTGYSKVLKFDVNVPEFTSEWSQVLIKNHPDLISKYFALADTSDRQIAIVNRDGKFLRLVGPGQKCLFWKVLNDITVEYVQISEQQEIDPEKMKTLVKKVPSSDEFLYRIVPEGYAGLLFIDGKLIKTLTAGAYAYWKGRANIDVVTVDLRLQAIEITGQEILTRDRVSLRVNLDAFYSVVNVAKAVTENKDSREYVYKEMQFALRKAVGLRTLDEVLSRKETLGEEVLAAVREKAVSVGLEIKSAGVRDVILPGDIREILNQVVSAEKQAQANLIRRREEVAATRSLLNTAKMIEANPVLMKLKEMESLEKVSEKIQSINVVGGLESLLGSIRK